MFTKFKPNLATNEKPDLDNIGFTKLWSKKVDGIRFLAHPELGLVTRSLKQIQNRQLQLKFIHLMEYSKINNVILDGEIYCHTRTFQEITRAVMTQDFEDEKTIKKLMKELKIDEEGVSKYTKELINDMEFYCFDYLDENNKIFSERYKEYSHHISQLQHCKIVYQTTVNNKEAIIETFKEVLEDGYEGLILKDPNSYYKYGRTTLKEDTMIKFKPYETFDARIIGVQQATEVNPEVEKTINELGNSVTSKKKGDRVLIEKASAFFVDFEGQEQKVALAMTDEEKEEVWKNKEKYIGKMIEFQGMKLGAKEKIRHPTTTNKMIRFREDRD